MAGFGTFGILLAFWIVGWGAEFAGGGLRGVLQYLSFTDHLDSFTRGLIDTKDLDLLLDRHRAGPVPHPPVARVEAVEGIA